MLTLRVPTSRTVTESPRRRPGVTTNFLIDSLNPTGYAQVLDELVSGAVTKAYTYGLQRISENQLVGSTWTPSFYGYDGHGNVRFLTSTTGAVGNTYQYDAFGMPIASAGTTANTYLYSGERFDQNIGLYHLRARYYNQGTGRFETMDPYEGNVFKPKTLHRYLYAESNPANLIDPSGNDVDEYSFVGWEDIKQTLKGLQIYKNCINGLIDAMGADFLALSMRDELYFEEVMASHVTRCFEGLFLNGN